MNANEIVDYTKSLDCIHCGLCLRTCPTYQVTGRESSSPRGRIHMMRSLAEGDAVVDKFFIDELDYCLVCRNCESACPSGVQYSELLSHTRAALAEHEDQPWLRRTLLRIGLRRVLPSRRLISLNVALLRFAQRTGIAKLLTPLLGNLGKAMNSMPEAPAAHERRALDPFYPAEGSRRGTVATLEGCVMPALLGRVNRASVHVLQAAGRDVHVPQSPTCCGALHAHNGDLETARKLARQTITAFDLVRDDSDQFVPVVVNSAGCSAQMKEYGELLKNDPEWKTRAEQFAARVQDFSEYPADHALSDLKTQLTDPREKLASPIAFDDPCHLCHGQGVRSQPRVLLDEIGVQRVEIDESESCCGSAGLYSALRPEDSREILQPRLEALRKCAARTLVTANPGCHLQWQSGVESQQLDVEVLHIAEVLERSLK
jgi:glycolate oxidase iron-sulfur subunit